jgi:peptidoglycan hydrolase-like protein with peptidoglycan-binding domain
VFNTGFAGLDPDSTEIVPNQDFDIVRMDSEGTWVVKLQKALTIEADGKFGLQTEAALKTFQTAHGLEADGVAGRHTYRTLGLIG